MVDTGIAIALPEGTYRMLTVRSGMTSKIEIAVGGGIILMYITPERLRSYFNIMIRWTACIKHGIR